MSSHIDWEKMDGKPIRSAWFRNQRPDIQPYVEVRDGRTLTFSAVYMGDRTELWIIEHEGEKEISRYNASAMESIHWL